MFINKFAVMIVRVERIVVFYIPRLLRPIDRFHIDNLPENRTHVMHVVVIQMRLDKTPGRVPEPVLANYRFRQRLAERRIVDSADDLPTVVHHPIH